MSEEFLRIPKARVGALVGEGGRAKKILSGETGCAIDVSHEGDVTVTGEDPLAVFKAKDIVKAIGRGFSQKDAIALMDDDYTLHIISLQEEFGESDKTISRVKSRVLGMGGAAKKRIQDATQAKIAVYGKTISILGKHDDVHDAEEIIRMLMGGATHKSAYIALQRRRVARKNFDQ